MVVITDVAAQEIQDALEAEGLGERGVRIFISGIGCSGYEYGFAIAEEEEDVDSTEINGVNIYMDDETQESLDGMEIDLVELPQGKGFVVRDPNTDPQNPCGPCGGCSH